MTNPAAAVTFGVVIVFEVFLGTPFVCGQKEESTQASRNSATSVGSEPASRADSTAAVQCALIRLTGKAVRIVTSGGGQFQGTLLSVAADRVELRDSEGLIQQIWRADIVAVIDLEAATAGVTYFQDAAESRLLVMPTGFPLPKHDFQVTDQEIALVTASYGVTDNFSLWGGLSIPGAVVNARFGFAIGDRVGLSVGTMVGFSWLFDSPSGVGLPYVIASFGSPNQNFTVGASVPIFGSASTAISATGAIAALAGKIVVSPSASLVTENWFYVPWQPTTSLSYAFPALAFRIAGSRFSWDIGAVVPIKFGPSPQTGRFTVDGVFDGQVLPLPLLSFTYRI